MEMLLIPRMSAQTLIAKLTGVAMAACSCAFFCAGSMDAAVSSSVFVTRLAELESPITAKLNATFAGISDATRGSSPAHSQRTTFEVYATYARSAADLSTAVLHASTVFAGDAKAESKTTAKRIELYLSEHMASTSLVKFLNVAGRH